MKAKLHAKCFQSPTWFSFKYFCSVFLTACLSSCSLSPAAPDYVSDDPFTRPPSFREIIRNAEANADADDSSAQLRQYGRHWLYGRGFGRTLANVGTVVLFPPYALYLLGNAGLALAGYEPLYLTSALPEEARNYTLEIYDNVTSVPGRVSASLAGEAFQAQPFSVKQENNPLQLPNSKQPLAIHSTPFSDQ